MISHCGIALAALIPVGGSLAANDGLERLTEFVKEPAPGASVVEYLPGEPIVVYHRITNGSTQPARVSVWDLKYRIRVLQPDGQRLWQHGEEVHVDPAPGAGEFPLKAGGQHDGYLDLTLLYTSVLPEEGELDVFLPWPKPGRTQRIEIASPATESARWHSDYVKLHQVKRWIRGFGGEVDPRARVDPPVGLGLLEEIAEGRTYLREWAMYYKGWYIQRVVAQPPEEKVRWKERWRPEVIKAFREFLHEYPQSVAAPQARAYVGRYAQPASGDRAAVEAKAARREGRAAAGRSREGGRELPGSGAAPTAVPGDRRGQRGVAAGATPTRDEPRPGERSRRTPFLLVAGVAAVAAAASAVVIARRRRGT